jgi:ABC-type lipoprotein export system ATPase subunit
VDIALARMTAASKTFGFVEVFKNVDLDLRAGTITAITGPVGAGKTTMLRCIAGVEPLTTGRRVLNAPVVGLVLTLNQSEPIALHTDMTSPCLVVTDEPSYAGAYSGALTAFVCKLLRSLADHGHAVAVGTHDTHVLNRADAVVDL